VGLISLNGPGRQEVEGWPTVPGVPSSADVEALLEAVQARGEDKSVPEPERRKLEAVLAALRELGTDVTAEIIVAWGKTIGLP
jgi:hypothetical protein